MRAFVVTAPGEAGVQEVEPPVAAPGEVVVDVARVGLCGTDVEFFTGEMQYLHDGHARFPMRLGHEWAGTVSTAGPGVDPGWLGRRVTGDTMLGCGRCRRCRTGYQHVCEARAEIGIRGGRPGALAEQLPVPVTALHVLPDTVDAVRGALVEPGGNALRAVRGADLGSGDRLLVLGPGTIGLLAAMFARAAGAEVHVLGLPGSQDFVRALGFDHAWTEESLPELPFLIDTRALVLKDVTAVGVLSASPGIAGAIEHYACGAVDPVPLVAATVGLDEVAAVLAGRRPGPGPKIQVNPQGAA
jgi:threonine dehydrogenase-like Zn-dependent dehydrogenase